MISIFRNKSSIIQFSPIRSGSTLVFNFLKEVFPEKTITKSHKLNKWEEKTATLICTYRNPVDCISSNLLFLDKPPTEVNIREQIHLLKTQGLVQLCRILSRKDIVLLKYEAFYKDHSVIFNSLETFFGISFNEDQKSTISQKFQVKKVKENYASKFENAFEFDRENHWHGNHISPFNGRPNSAPEILTEDQIRMIQTELQDYIGQLGYKLIG